MLPMLGYAVHIIYRRMNINKLNCCTLEAQKASATLRYPHVPLAIGATILIVTGVVAAAGVITGIVENGGGGSNWMMVVQNGW